VQCPECDFRNPDASKFCAQCGAGLARPTCPECDAEIVADARFCNHCGHRLDSDHEAEAGPAPQSLAQRFETLEADSPDAVSDIRTVHHVGENRFVTVLFADMTSSVATTHGLRADEAAELVNRLLSAMVESLKRYDGRIDRFLGDGALAVFGTPHAHENDPERAIRAAVEIRDAAGELGLGVTAGINSGEVFFGEMGSEQHSELTVMGPVVNLAARLQGKADAGQIIVGEATYRHTRRMFGFDDLSVEIKGIDGVVAAHRVEEELERPERVRGIEGLRAELIGRDRELADLQDALAKALGGDGQIATVIGEAGVGKSRLTSELQQFAMTPTEDRAAPLWLEGRCVELAVTASYWPFIDAFHAYFGTRTDDDDSVRAGAITAALQDLVDSGHLTAEKMDEIGPLWGHMRSVKFGNEWDDRLKFADGQQIRHQTFHAVRDFLLALSRRQPLVLVLDDLHWADTLSIDLIAFLMESLADAHIFLLCVYRPERDHRCWRLGSIAERKCAERYQTMTLRELTPDESRALIEALLNIESLGDAVKEMILDKAHGNPFFVEEVVRSLIDSGVVYRDGGAWVASEDISSVTVPDTVQSVVLSRVDRLDAELRHVLQSASVIGRVFRRSVLERVATQSTDIEQALWELEDHALIYQGRTVPEPEYVFRHALTHDAVYQTVVQRRRIEFHGSVAREMEALYAGEIDEHVEQLAYHYERGGEQAKATEYLLLSADGAAANYAHDSAIEYYERAASSTQPPATREEMARHARALAGLGQVYTDAGRAEDALPHFRRAIELSKRADIPARETALLCDAMGEAMFWADGDTTAAGEEGLALLEEGEESVEAALLTSRLAFGKLMSGVTSGAGFLDEMRHVADYLEGLATDLSCVCCTSSWDSVKAGRAARDAPSRY
jgi:class 3 adenylate cyclase/tetratricopeptide (TPR) repeat protein